jgi:hypothetical protein
MQLCFMYVLYDVEELVLVSFVSADLASGNLFLSMMI